MSIKPIIVWFRQDLRLTDHPGLRHAVESGQPVIPVYVHDEATPGVWQHGGASRWWLHHSLSSLAADLEARGSALILRRGAAREQLQRLVADTGADRLVMSRAYEPWARVLEADVYQDMTAQGIKVSRFEGTLLFDPDKVRTKTGVVYKVYTPFWRTVSTMPMRALAAAPRAIPTPASRPKSDRLHDWALLPVTPDWSGGMREAWAPGEAGASKRLDTFLKTGLADYNTMRNRPDVVGTSRLSPHLRFGEISPATCWHRARAIAANNPKLDQGLETFLKELVWREFSYHLLYHWPTLPTEPFKSEFAKFPWVDNDHHLRAWQKGQTGFPIVDAGMRELWTTGWMHNRVRMIVGSFLVKDLLLPWQAGEAWFWDCLVDADLASNAASWQWVAGSGADAAPYFRVFNPQKQGETFDPDGAYVRRWVPEIARLPDKYIHAPAAAPRDVLAQCGVALGKTYPLPMVDHAAARERALAAFKTLKAAAV